MAWHFSARDFVLGLVAGGLIAAAIISAGILVLLRSSNMSSLGHWKLNLRMPLASMWINLGYWKTNDGKPIVNFDQATRALLEKMIDAAKLSVDGDDGARCTNRSISVLDVGFGCGDQSLALAEMTRAPERPRFQYVGLTLDAAQVQTAQRRLDRAFSHNEDSAAGGVGGGLTQDSFKLFRANAAKPETWSTLIRASVQGLRDKSFSERWLLALDCLYHFSPSRKPVFQLAARKLGANVMAFDLVLDDKASAWDTLLVRVIGLVMNCPLHTFLTEEQYKGQLVECGYDAKRIEIYEISNDVFAGVSGFLKRQDAALSEYGISLGGYKLAGRLFEWFDRTRVVKAVIVVARTEGAAVA